MEEPKQCFRQCEVRSCKNSRCEINKDYFEVGKLTALLHSEIKPNGSTLSHCRIKCCGIVVGEKRSEWSIRAEKGLYKRRSVYCLQNNGHLPILLNTVDTFP